MNESAQYFYGLDASIVAWVAAGLAAMFIVAIAWDYLRQRQKQKRIPRRFTALSREAGFLNLFLKTWRTNAAARRRRK